LQFSDASERLKDDLSITACVAFDALCIAARKEPSSNDSMHAALAAMHLALNADTYRSDDALFVFMAASPSAARLIQSSLDDIKYHSSGRILYAAGQLRRIVRRVIEADDNLRDVAEIPR